KTFIASPLRYLTDKYHSLRFYITFGSSGCRRRHTHAPQPTEMGSEPGAEGNVLAVFHAEFSTCLFHQSGNGRVVDVADAREEVMFNLKIQSAQEPTLQPAAAGKVHGGFGLMDRPAIFYGAGIFSR